MSVTRLLGDTLTYTFTVYDEDNARHQPSALKVSLLKGDGSEDTIVLGGTDPSDAYLVQLTGVANYKVSYPLNVVGVWDINEWWSDDNWVHTIKGASFSVTVINDPHTGDDVALP